VTDASARAPVHAYHDGTKHHFRRFARSLGYLDWASQPNPFRSFAGAPVIPLAPRPGAPVTAVGNVLRHALGLSAWKQLGASRWALRVNPSSGNLHPTEAYVIAGPAAGLGEAPAVFHYAPDRHVLEQRCALDAAAWSRSGDAETWLIALSSIHWREAWKYGERAFRYCQHDTGHAIAAVSIAAALEGLTATLLPEWSHADIAAITGIDRDADYVEAEREEPGCIMAIHTPHPPSNPPSAIRDPQWLLAAVRSGQWSGHASQLSDDHTTWSFIDEIAAATRDPGRNRPISNQLPDHPITQLPDRRVLLQRRSAVAFDGVSALDAATFFRMLSAVMPRETTPWNALWWDARIHLAVFVHRVDEVAPGLYLLARDASALERLRAACGREFLWQRASDSLPLFLLAPGDCRSLARRLSCDQDIAADGFFSLGMIAELDASLDAFGPSFYRYLFWEAGVVGQVLYLEAESAGARATGIGCFYDDPVHDVLGIADHRFQSLYHFTVGRPVDDTRLTTAPGYPWET
jgi:SagB-type dehydrogenase family enzyme